MDWIFWRQAYVIELINRRHRLDRWACGFLRCLRVKIPLWVFIFIDASIIPNDRRCGALHFSALTVDFDAV